MGKEVDPLMDHDLKTDPDVYDDVVAGLKKFEIRFDDRNYNVCDTLNLHKTQSSGDQMRAGAPLEYTGDTFAVKVIYLLRGPIYGLKEGWVIMGIDV